MNKDYRATYDYAMILSKLTGETIGFFKSDRSDKQKNGAYDPVSGITLIDLESGRSGGARATGAAFSHEFVHFARHYNEALYQNLRAFVMNDLGGNLEDGGSWKQYVKQRMEAWDVSEDIAEEEVVAEACQNMLKDSEVFKRYAIADYEGAKTFRTRLVEFLNRLRRLVRSVFKGDIDTNVTQAISDLEGLQKEFDRVLEAVIKMPSANDTQAVKEALDGMENIVDEIVKNKDGQMEIAKVEGGKKILYSETTYVNGGRSALIDALKDEGYNKSEIDAVVKRIDRELGSIKELGQFYATKSFDKLAKNLEADITISLADEKKLLDRIEAAGVIDQETINSLRAEYQQTVYAYVPNGDYALNIDLQLSCKKRIAYETIINMMLDAGIMNDVRMNGELIGEINTILAAHEFETQCLGCFVESRRLQMQKWAETIAAEWNQQVTRVTGKKFSEKLRMFPKIGKSDRDQSFEAHQIMEEAIKSGARDRSDSSGGIVLKSSSVYDKMGELIAFDPKHYGKFLSAEDVLTAKGIEAIRRFDDGNLFSIVKQRYGTASPKIVQGFNPYNAEVLKLTFDSVKKMTGKGVAGASEYRSIAQRNLTKEDLAKIDATLDEYYSDLTGDARKDQKDEMIANKVEHDAIRQYMLDIGGNRIQSFSDFMIENVFDMFQLFHDFAVRDYSMHGYTKEQICLRLFGMTGAKWNGSWISHNISQMGKEYSGLMPYTAENAKNGITVEVDGEKYVIQFDDYERHIREKSFIQSIGFKDAIAIMLDPRYADNVGTITIGFSDKHIRAMLNSPYFRMVIPYHASGMIPGFAELVGADTYNDYTDYQNTTPKTAVVYENGKKVGEYNFAEKKKKTGFHKEKGDYVVKHNGEKMTIKFNTGFEFNEALQRLGDARDAADEYIAWCGQEHETTTGNKTYTVSVVYAPKFSNSKYGYDFTKEHNYYKLLEDFNVYNSREEIINGVSVNARQGGVKMLYPGDVNLSAEELAQYRKDLEQTGLFSAKEIDKYVKKAQMTFDELVKGELESRNAYHENVFNNANVMAAFEEIKNLAYDKYQRSEEVANNREEYQASQTKAQKAKKDANKKLLKAPEGTYRDNSVRPSSRDDFGSDRDSEGNVLSQAQQEYFADSQVRDEDGNLMVVWHGSANGGNFTVFDAAKLNNSKLSSHIGQGFYFTNSEKGAREYLNNSDIYGNVTKGTAPHLFKGYLNITNPLVITESSKILDYDTIRNIVASGNRQWFFDSGLAHTIQNKEIAGQKYSKDEILKMSIPDRISLYARYLTQYGDMTALNNMVDAYAMGEQGQLLKAMQAFTGHDGIIWKMQNGVNQYVAFNSNQFKNIDNTNPTSSEDIRYSVRTLSDGTEYVKLDGNIFLKEDGTEMTPREAYNTLVGMTITLPDGDDVTFVKRLPGGKDIYNELFRRRPAFDIGIDINLLNDEVNRNIIELLTNSVAMSKNEPDHDNRHAMNGISTFDTRMVRIADDNGAYILKLSIAQLTDGRKIAYAKKHIEKDDETWKKIQAEEGTSESRFPNLLNTNISQSETDVKKNAQRDSEYMDAVESGDMETAQKMVEKAAKEAGYTIHAYHGTNGGNFNTFKWDNTQRADGGWYGRGHYFTPYDSMAKMYGDRVINAYLKITKPFNFKNEVYSIDGVKASGVMPNDVAFLINMSEKFPSVFGDRYINVYDSKSYSTKQLKWSDVRNELNEVKNGMELVEFADGRYKWRYEVTPIHDAWSSEYYDNKADAEKGKTDDATTMLMTEKYEWNDAPISPEAYYLSGDAVASNAFTEELKKQGYDGVLQADNGDEIVVFDSSQIKSADPVTYDDQGNVIPLSERFNSENDDIRYSLRSVPSVEPTTDEWQSGHSEAWFRENGYPIREDVSQEWLQKRIEKGWWEGEKEYSQKGFDKTSKKEGTQISSTVSTYEKLYDMLERQYPNGEWKNLRILDASSGLGLGTKRGLERGFNVTDIEPYVHPDSDYFPDYMDYSSLQDKVRSGDLEPFDFIISNAVLNVIPQDTRDAMVDWFDSVLAPGGRIFVSTLGAKYTNDKTDNDGTKVTQRGKNGGGSEIYVKGSNSVQKGFSRGELQAYLRDALGGNYTFENAPSGIGRESATIATKGNTRFSPRDIANSESEMIVEALKGEGDEAQKQSILAYAKAYKEVQDLEKESLQYTKDLKNASPSEREVLYKKLLRVNRAITNKTTELTEMRTQRVLRDVLINEWNKKLDDVEWTNDLTYQRTVRALERKYGSEITELRKKSKAKQKEIRDRYEINRHKKNIEKKTKELMDRILHGTEKKHIPSILVNPIVEMLDSIDYWTPAEEKRISVSSITKKSESLRERFLNFRQAIKEYQDAINQGAAMTEYMFDDDFLDEVEELCTSVKDIKNVNDMSLKEIEDLDHVLTQLNHLISRGNKMIIRSHYESLEDAVGTTAAELIPRQDVKKTAGSWRQRLNAGMADTYAFGEYAGDGARQIVDMLSEANEKRIRQIRQVTEFANKTLEGTGFEKWRDESHTFSTQEGKDVTMTVPQMMELYLLNNREQARNHIYGEGISVEKKKGKFTSAVKVTEEDVSQMIQYLKQNYPTAVKVADELQKFGATVLTDLGTEASNLLWGISKFTDPNYWQIRSDTSYMKEDKKLEESAPENASLYRLQSLGRTKATNPNANNAIHIGDVFDTFLQTVDDMTAYSSILPATTDALRWFNSMVTLDDGKKIRVKKLLQNKLGTDMTRVFTESIKAMNGGITHGNNSLEGLVGKLMGNAKAASVAGNLRVVFQQPTAYTRAYSVMEAKYLDKALRMKPAIKEMQEHSAIGWWKSQGFFSNGLAPSLRKLILNDSTLSEKITEKTLLLAGLADDVTWGTLWNAAKLKVEDTMKNLEKGSKEYFDAIEKVHSNVINQTQVVDTPLTKAMWMRGGGAGKSIVALYTAFQNEPMKTYSMVSTAIDKALRGEDNGKKLVARALMSFALNAVVNAMAQAIADAARDDDQNKSYFQKYLEKFKENALDNANPLTYIPVIKEAWSMTQGFSNNRLDLQAIQNTINAGTELQRILNHTSTKTLFGQVETIAKAVSSWTGIPLTNVMRTFNSFGNLTGLDIFRRKEYTNKELARNIVVSAEEGNPSDAEKYREQLEENIRKSNGYKKKKAEYEKKGEQDIPGLMDAYVDTQVENSIVAYLAENSLVIEEYAQRYIDDPTTILDAVDVLGDYFSEDIITRAVRKYANQNGEEVGDTTLAKGNSIYTSKDLNRLLENGEIAKAQTIINEINSAYKDVGSNTTAKDAVSDYWKPKYLAATGAERDRIAKMLYRLKNNGKQMYSSKDLQKWVKDAKK